MGSKPAASTTSLVILDDQPESTELIVTACTELGLECQAFSTGKEFCDHVLKSPPDIVVLDIVMPGMDGIEIIQWMADHDLTHVPLGLVSGKKILFLESATTLATVAGFSKVCSMSKVAGYGHTKEFVSSLLAGESA